MSTQICTRFDNLCPFSSLQNLKKKILKALVSVLEVHCSVKDLLFLFISCSFISSERSTQYKKEVRVQPFE